MLPPRDFNLARAENEKSPRSVMGRCLKLLLSFRIPTRAGIQTPPSFQQACAWQHSYRAPLRSFQRRLESSGLNNSFPQRGNDNLRGGPPTRHPINPVTHSPPRPRSPRPLVPDTALPPRPLVPDAALPPASMQAYIPVGVDSGLRRDDGEEYFQSLRYKMTSPSGRGVSCEKYPTAPSFAST